MAKTATIAAVVNLKYTAEIDYIIYLIVEIDIVYIYYKM